MQNDQSQITITSNGLPIGANSAAAHSRITPIESRGAEKNATEANANRQRAASQPDNSNQPGLSISELEKIELALNQGKIVPQAHADEGILNSLRSALPILIKTYKMHSGNSQNGVRQKNGRSNGT